MSSMGKGLRPAAEAAQGPEGAEEQEEAGAEAPGEHAESTHQQCPWQLAFAAITNTAPSPPIRAIVIAGSFFRMARCATSELATLTR